MKTKFIIVLTLFFTAWTTYAQHNPEEDSVDYYYENYRFQSVINYIKKHKIHTTANQNILVHSYIQLGRYGDAIYVLTTLIESEPENIKYKIELAKLYLKMNSLDKALLIFNQLSKKDTKNPYYWRKIAQILEKSFMIPGALKAYQKALKINPNDQESGENYAKLLLKIKEFKTADSIANHFLNKNYPNKLPFLKLKLKASYLQKNYEEVVSTANRLFALNDSSLVTIKLLGITEYKLGNYSRSIDLLSLLLDEKIEEEQVYFYLGVAYRASKNHKEANKHFNAAIQASVSENIAAYYTQLAANYQEMGEFSKAIEAYKIAYESSNEKQLIYHIARAYDLYYKDKTVAINYYKKYISFNDSSEKNYFIYSKERLKQLKAMRHFETDTSN